MQATTKRLYRPHPHPDPTLSSDLPSPGPSQVQCRSSLSSLSDPSYQAFAVSPSDQVRCSACAAEGLDTVRGKSKHR